MVELNSTPGKPEQSSIDDIVNVYKRDVDRTMLRANLRLSVTERVQRFQQFARFAAELHKAGREHRGEA